MNQETKKEIDKMPYYKMLGYIKALKIDSKYFVGETGRYWFKVLNKKKERLKCLVK